MQLEPQCLGLYWPVRHEFNAAVSLATLAGRIGLRRALPFCTRTPARAGDGDDAGMHYRAWDGRAPTLVDACGIASADGPEVVPDVVLVPCLGYTASGYRLGYGAGFFDRWLARHAGVTAIGVAWSVGRLEPHEFSPQPHDQPLMAVVTEDGPVREGDASAARVAAA